MSKIYESYPISVTLFKQIGLVRLDSRLTQIIKTEMLRECLRLPSSHRRLLKVPAVEIMTWRRALKTPPRKSRPSHTFTWVSGGSFAESCTYLLTVNHSKSDPTKAPGHFVWFDPKKEVPPISPPPKERDLPIFTFVWDDSFQLALGQLPRVFLLEKGVTPLKTNVPSHFKKAKKSSSNFQPSKFSIHVRFQGGIYFC